MLPPSPNPQSGELLIRGALRHEFPMLEDLERRAAQRFLEVPELTGMTAEQLEDTLSVAELERSLAEAGLCVAEWAGTPAGFVATHRYGDALYIRELDVLPEFGGRGIGRSLLERALEMEARDYFLRTFREVAWNAPFYRRVGFDEVPESEWTQAMHAIVREEDEWGLRADKRLFMRLRDR